MFLRRKKKEPQPIQVVPWKKDIKEDINFTDFCKAWKDVFFYCFDECEIHSISNGDLTVITPNGLHSDGSYGEYTDNPRLDNLDNSYYSCGVTYALDLDGNYYYLLDRNTNGPYNKNAIPFEIIKRFIDSNGTNGIHLLQNINRTKKVKKLISKINSTKNIEI